MAIIDNDNKYGYIDKTGKMVIKPTFDVVTDFSDGLAAVAIKQIKYYNNKTEPEYSKIWGYIDTTGKVVIEFKYEKAYPFINGKAVVYNGDIVSFIDKESRYLTTGYSHIKYRFRNKIIEAWR